MNCFFCAVVNKEIPAKILFDDDEVVAFSDINPAAPTHILIVPRKHSDSLALQPMTGISGQPVGDGTEVGRRDEDGRVSGGDQQRVQGRTVGFSSACTLLGGREFSLAPRLISSGFESTGTSDIEDALCDRWKQRHGSSPELTQGEARFAAEDD
jgi:hypothetical protein